MTASKSGCAVCGGQTYVIERKLDRAQARVCACSEACGACGGTGNVLVEREETFSKKVGPRRYEVLAPCFCAVRKGRLALFNGAGIPGVLAGATLDSYRPQNGAQDRARTVARDFALQYRRGGGSADVKGFILSGPVGTGKTHLLTSVLGHITLEVGVAARYVEISLLYATIRRGFQEGKSGGEIIGPLSEVEVLAIDELGKGRGSQFEMETLDELIARRYNAGRVTLFATNYSLEPEKAPAPRSPGGYRETPSAKGALGDEQLLLRERVGERIYSRLCDLCTFVELPKETPDHRRLRQEGENRTLASTRGR